MKSSSQNNLGWFDETNQNINNQKMKQFRSKCLMCFFNLPYLYASFCYYGTSLFKTNLYKWKYEKVVSISFLQIQHNIGNRR